MFQTYRTIIKDSTQSEIEITKKYDLEKEQIALEIKDALENESKKITQGQILKSYNPVEISNQITTLQHRHQNCITEEVHNLEKLQQDTEEKLLHEMKYKPILKLDNSKSKIPITEIYKDIYCHDNGNCWVCRVWFSLVGDDDLNLKPGDPFKVAWFDINENRHEEEADNLTYLDNISIIKRVIKKNGDSIVCNMINELKMPGFPNQSSITHAGELFHINHWGEKSSQKTFWLEWVKRNRPIPE